MGDVCTVVCYGLLRVCFVCSILSGLLPVGGTNTGHAPVCVNGISSLAASPGCLICEVSEPAVHNGIVTVPASIDKHEGYGSTYGVKRQHSVNFDEQRVEVSVQPRDGQQEAIGRVS